MKILVVGKLHVEGFAQHIADAPTDASYSISTYDWNPSATPSFDYPGFRTFVKAWGTAKNLLLNLRAIRAAALRPLLKHISSGRFDLVIVCHDFFWPSEVENIRGCSAAKVVLWFPDTLTTIDRAYFLNSSYDALFLKDPYMVRKVRDLLGRRVYYLPECCNPKEHSAEVSGDDLSGFFCDIATAGNFHSWRVSLFKRLASLGFVIRLWGKSPPAWQDVRGLEASVMHRPVYGLDKVRAFKGAKIVVNNLLIGEVESANVRLFEAAAAGAFQLVDYRRCISDFFVDGEELVMFRGYDDLVDKIRYWLGRDDERRQIAAAGKVVALRDHTYARRIELMIQCLFHSGGGYKMPTPEPEL